MRPAAAALAVLLLAGCGGAAEAEGLDDRSQFACDDFAKGYPKATTAEAQLELARVVNVQAKSAEEPDVQLAGEGLARSAGAPAWQTAADTFATACTEAGWKP